MAAPAATGTGTPKQSELSREDQTLLLFSGLMEGGKEDDETVRDLDRLTQVLNDDVAATKRGERSICALVDADCVDTLLGYLDMRQPAVVRGHATLTTSAYLQAAGDDGAQKLSAFFHDRVRRGTYDDYIVAFCVAATVFPIVPDLTAELFLSEGFLPSLGPLMRRKWKSRKVETACLDMLNAACMHAACREAVQKYCLDWLEEIVDQDPDDVVKDMFAANHDGNPGEGSVSMLRHSRQVQNLAAVILAKMKAILPPPTSDAAGDRGRVEPASTSLEDLSAMFTTLLVSSPAQNAPNAVEGLAYASLQPAVRARLAADDAFLRSLVQTLRDAPPRSPLTYGALSIFANLTRYQPKLSEEQKRLGQLQAYAAAAGGTGAGPGAGAGAGASTNPLVDDEHVAERCKQVFAAGVVPVLVTHSRNGSAASLGLIVGIVHALSATASLRGPLVQQGAVRLLMEAWDALEAGRGGEAQPAGDEAGAAAGAARPPPPPPPPSRTDTKPVQRAAAHALARILISTDPDLVFGGARPLPVRGAIRPLAWLLKPGHGDGDGDGDGGPAGGGRSLLPVYEALMALTNLASTDEYARGALVRAAWPDVEEHMLSGHAAVTRAAVELVCNLSVGPSGGQLYAADTPQARNRLHVLLALTDAEDLGTRRAAAGALAQLLALEAVVAGVLARPGGVERVLSLCATEARDDEGGEAAADDMRLRGVMAVYSMVGCDDDGAETGKKARAAVRQHNGETVLVACARTSKHPEVVEGAALALGVLRDKP